MSIYYNHHQSYHSKGFDIDNKNSKVQINLDQFQQQRNRLQSNSAKKNSLPQKNTRLSRMQAEQQWQRLDDLREINKNGLIRKETNHKVAAKGQSKIANQKDRSKEKVNKIVTAVQERDSFPQICDFVAQFPASESLDLSASTITVQSNEREKNNKKQSKKEKNVAENKKYLFYNLIKQETIEIKDQNKPQKSKVSKEKSGKNQVINLQKEQRKQVKKYQYQKGVHKQEQPFNRLKNKLGFILDLFQKEDEAASVSYYTEQHSLNNSKAQLAEPEQKIRQSAKKMQKIPEKQNIFDIQMIPQNKEEEVVNSNIIKEKQNLANQFQNIDVVEQRKSIIHSVARKKSLPEERNHENTQKQQIIKKSLQKIIFSNLKAKQQKSYERMSKSIQNRKKSRYSSSSHENQNNITNLNKSKQFKKLEPQKNQQNQAFGRSRKASDPSQSRSQDSKFSIALIRVREKSLTQKQKSQPQKKQEQNGKKAERIQNNSSDFQQQRQQLRQQALMKEQQKIKSNLYRNYLKVDYKDSNSSKKDDQDSIPDIIPTIIFPNSNRAIDNNSSRQKIQIIKNTERNQMVNPPINKIQFSLNRLKKFKTEFSQKLIAPQNLSDQQKKFVTLMKKRQEGMLRKVKDHLANNNIASLYGDRVGDIKEGNGTLQMHLRRQSSQAQNKFAKNYYQAERSNRFAPSSEHSKNHQVQSLFPTLNLSPRAKNLNFQTFYNDNPLLRKNKSNKNTIHNSRPRKGYSEPVSSESERERSLDFRFEEMKTIKKQRVLGPLTKMEKVISLRDKKNVNSIEKNERLKALLEKM